MNNLKSEGAQEYEHVTSSVEDHYSKDMIAKVALFTDDDSVITDDVANKVIKKEITTANESSGLSYDDIDIKAESPSEWDPLQVKEDEVFNHQNDWSMEMQQQQPQNLQTISDDVITAKQFLLPQPAVNQISTRMIIYQHPVLLGAPIQVNTGDIGPNALQLSTNKSVPSSLSKDTSVGSVCQSNISNKPVAASIPTAFVEQPTNLPCSCFVCGLHLSNPSDGFYYLKSHKLTNSQITLLELLSDVLNQIVASNTGTVNLCSRCSGLISETDSVYTRLNLLKKQICKLFIDKQQMKLTYQALPTTCNLRPVNMNPVPLVYHPPELNLNNLAATTCRLGSQPNEIQLRKPMTSESAISNPPVQVKKKRSRPRKVITSELAESNPPVQVKKKRSRQRKPSELAAKVKKKRGRPRKPFGCHVCKRKFCTKEMVLDHMMREHKHPEELGRVRSESDPGLRVEEDGKSEKINQENVQIKQQQDDYTGKIQSVSNSQSTDTYRRKFCTKKMVLNYKREHWHPEELRRVSRVTDPGIGVEKDGKSEKINQENLQIQQQQAYYTEKIQPVSNTHSTDTTKSVKDSRIGHSTSSPNLVKQQKTGMDVAQQLLASMRPIQPKPQTVKRTEQDGSMVSLMSPPEKVGATSGYINQESGPNACGTKKKKKMHRKVTQDLRKQKQDEIKEKSECGGIDDGLLKLHYGSKSENYFRCEKVLTYNKF
ncbi:uncharacterized protein [Palaemon carinicauda]|uniref:uncharacterized protein n=1 Tax=Palaemon carinicauda TaxID=392227 RepID=UPI0035B675F2